MAKKSTKKTNRSEASLDTAKFNMAVDHGEYKKYKAAAKSAGMTLAGWARTVLRKALK